MAVSVFKTCPGWQVCLSLASGCGTGGVCVLISVASQLGSDDFLNVPALPSPS